jgi:sugar O-acyltransferase (sialic acid O-acetyltransferase NeuD family)
MILYGAGGHAKVIIENLRSEGKQVQGVFDDNTQLTSILGVAVLGKYDAHTLPETRAIVAIGNNKIRAEISKKIQHKFGKALHTRAHISETAHIGEGTVVMPNAAINAEAAIGKHCIINTGAVVEHDCHIADYVHVAPNATLCGHVSVGEGTLIGAGAVVTPLVKIGKWAVINAGAVVSQDVADFAKIG